MDDFAPLLFWYEQHARDLPWRRTRDPYRIWISEIMLQQTRVAAVIGYYERFLARFPDVAALAAADPDALDKAWEGLGYYSRARNLQRAAKRMVTEYGGALPGSYEALLTLPGIGEYTAGAVASIAFGLPVPAVDGNVLRVFARLDDDPSDVGDPAVKRRVRERLLLEMPKEAPGMLNQALMELGATVCVPNGVPRCASCPMAPVCFAQKNGTAQQLPNKSGKRPRRIEEKTVFALETGEGYLGYRREKSGLLAGLWQLPDAPGTLDAAGMAGLLTAWGVEPVGEISVYARRHIFTHVEWRMRVCAVRVAVRALPADWVVLGERHSLPTAYRVCLPTAKETV